MAVSCVCCCRRGRELFVFFIDKIGILSLTTKHHKWTGYHLANLIRHPQKSAIDCTTLPDSRVALFCGTTDGRIVSPSITLKEFLTGNAKLLVFDDKWLNMPAMLINSPLVYTIAHTKNGRFIQGSSLLMCSGYNTTKLFDIKENTLDLVWSFDVSTHELASPFSEFPRALKFQGNIHFGYVGYGINTIFHVVYDESKKEHRVSPIATIPETADGGYEIYACVPPVECCVMNGKLVMMCRVQVMPLGNLFLVILESGDGVNWSRKDKPLTSPPELPIDIQSEQLHRDHYQRKCPVAEEQLVANGNLEDLLDVLLLQITGYLSPIDLLMLCYVSKRFHQFINKYDKELFSHWQVPQPQMSFEMVLDVSKLAPPERRRVIEGIHYVNFRAQNSVGLAVLAPNGRVNWFEPPHKLVVHSGIVKRVNCMVAGPKSFERKVHSSYWRSSYGYDGDFVDQERINSLRFAAVVVIWCELNAAGVHHAKDSLIPLVRKQYSSSAYRQTAVFFGNESDKTKIEEMKSFFEPIEKDMKIIIGNWDESSSIKEVLKIVAITASGKPQSINMDALEALQRLLAKLESQLKLQEKGVGSQTDQKTNKQSKCKTQ